MLRGVTLLASPVEKLADTERAPPAALVSLSMKGSGRWTYFTRRNNALNLNNSSICILH